MPICNLTNTDNDIKVCGVISDEIDNNEERSIGYGCFKTIQRKININETRVHINSLGEGSIWICNKNGNVQNGTYITSSSVPGYGIKQDSNQLLNSTVAKTTCDCDFSLTKISKQKLKVKEITTTYKSPAMKEVTESTVEIIYDEENDKYIQKTITQTNSVEEFIEVPLYNEDGTLLVDDNGNTVTHKIQKMEEHTDIKTEIDYDSNGNLQYEDDLDENGQQQMVYEYDTRFLNAHGSQITNEEYTAKQEAGEEVYIACFVGCTYHCG